MLPYSVNQAFAAKAEKPALSAKSRSEPASALNAGKKAFKHQLKAARVQTAKPNRGKAVPEASELQAGSSQQQMKTDLRCDGEGCCADVLKVLDSTQETDQQESGSEMQHLAESLLSWPAPKADQIQSAIKGNHSQQQADISALGAALTTASGPVEAGEALPATSEELLNAADKRTASQSSEAGHDDQGNKIKVILLGQNNQAFHKLKLSQDRSAPTKTADDPEQVNKLLDFESHRLRGKELPEGIKNSPEDAGQTNKPDLDISMMLNNRETAGTARIGTSTPNNSGQAVYNVEADQQLFDQVVERAKLLVKLNSSEMDIELKPDSLGKLSIKVLLEDGLVTARFITDNHRVKQVLESNLTFLRQNLENQGLKVDRTEVEVQVGNQQNFSAMGEWKQDSWKGQGGLQHNFNHRGEEATPLEVETEYMKGPEIATHYGYSADGQMNLLV